MPTTDTGLAIGEENLDSLSLVDLANVVLRHRMLIVVVTGSFAVLTIGLGLIGARTYTSTASFMPQGRRSAGSNLAGLAAQFGVAVPGSADAAQSPAFYADLVHSRQILGALIPAQYYVGPDSRQTVTLAELLKVKETDPAARQAETIRRLSDRITANPMAKTGVVDLSVKTTSAFVSQQVAARLIDEINRFNLQTRQSQASAERQFTELRLKEVRDSLRVAENALQDFLQTNRVVSGTSQLRLIEDRLRREVSQRQDIYSSLAQAYEQAKIEEVRDTPVITVIEQPNVPVRPDTRGLLSRGLLATLAGLVLGAAISLLTDIFARGRGREDAAFVELFRLLSEAASDFRHPLRALRRRSRA